MRSGWGSRNREEGSQARSRLAGKRAERRAGRVVLGTLRLDEEMKSPAPAQWVPAGAGDRSSDREGVGRVVEHEIAQLVEDEVGCLIEREVEVPAADPEQEVEPVAAGDDVGPESADDDV